MKTGHAILFTAVLTMAANASPDIATKADADYAKIIVPASNCVLVNNVWDRTAVPPGFVQFVYLDKRGRPGWVWNAPGARETVLSMPELVCGDKPWDAAQNLRPEFPSHPGEKRLTADFDIKLVATGRHNMAFSLWAVSKLPAVKQTITHEIMIWNVDAGVKHQGDKIGELIASGVTFDIYLDPKQGVVTGPDPFTWTLVSFVARKPLLKGSLDFGVFVDELLKQNILTRDHFLTNLELGTEVADGTGRVVVKKLNLAVH